MKVWLRISLLLCLFGFFRELRPSEPYVTEYLAGDFRNLTSEQIYQEVYPFGTYSVLVQLVIVFLITDILRYKPIIVLSAVSGTILFSFLLWTRSLLNLQIAQVFYGFFTAAEVAYYTYIYAKVDRERYQIVTGHTRAAILFGKFLGGVLAQVLVSTDAMSFRDLHFISLGTQIVSIFISLLLPKVPQSLYFFANGQDSKDDKSPKIATAEDAPKFSLKNAGRLFWYHLVSSYTNPTVLLWSILWALATCGQIQVISYIQFLWKEFAPDNRSVYNGGVEAVATLLGAIGAILAGLLNSNRRRNYYMLLNSICLAILGGMLLATAISNSVWMAYISYAIFCSVFFFIITVAGAIIAENLVDDSFGLVFGINMLVALCIQTVLVVVVVTDQGFGLGPKDQYIVYGGYFIVLGGIYLVLALILKAFSNKSLQEA